MHFHFILTRFHLVSIFVFNLIVGAGALSLPQAFAGAGYITGAVLLILLSFLSFMAVTFMVEAMSLGNALSKAGAEESNIQTGINHCDNSFFTLVLIIAIGHVDETEALLGKVPYDNTDASNFAIDKRLEMGAMASMFFSKIGVQLFYATMVICYASVAHLPMLINPTFLPPIR